MTLRQQMEDDISAVFLNEDEHGESVVYKFADDTKATITAICNADSTYQEDGSVLADQEQLACFVSLADVPMPRPGDRLVRTVNGEELTYTWTGAKQEEDGFGGRWLIFTRNVPYRIGGNR